MLRAEQPRTTTKPAARKLSSLVAPSRQTLRGLRRSGLQFQVVVPDTARALKVELVAKGKRAAVATATVKLAAGGAQKVTWKLDARTLAKVKAGRYILRVRAGKDARTHRTGQARARARAPRHGSLSRRRTQGRARRRPARTPPRRAPSRVRAAVRPCVRCSRRRATTPSGAGSPAGRSSAGLCLAALVAVGALLTGSFDDTDWRVVATSLGFSVFTSTTAAGAALRLRAAARARALGGAAVVTSVAAYVLLVAALWIEDAEGLWRAFGIAGLGALWSSHASLVVRALRPADPPLAAPPRRRSRS